MPWQAAAQLCWNDIGSTDRLLALMAIAVFGRIGGPPCFESTSLMFLRYDDWKGVESTRQRKSYKTFQMTLERRLGERIRADGACGVEMWSALANVDWHAPNGDIVGYSFRDAGDLVAWLREEGDYMDWYCCGDVGVVVPWIGGALAAEGWSWDSIESRVPPAL